MQFNPLDFPTLDLEPLVVSPLSAWIEHIPFGYALVAMTQPRRLVELGVHCGDSYCAFCQAIVHLGLPTQCFGIDTWHGDQHTRQYTVDVLKDLRSLHDPKFSSFSRLMPMEFDAALPQFMDGSVDLLHIDGLHTYEAVKHDFESWQPKMSQHGVVLFHDTKATHDDFGVHRLWTELTRVYPNFEFEHGEGLGILCVGREVPRGLSALIQATPQETAVIRSFYSRLGFIIAMRRFYSQVMHGVFQGQAQINYWKQATGQPITPGSQQLAAAMNNALGFTRMLVQDISALAADDLRLRDSIPRSVRQ